MLDGGDGGLEEGQLGLLGLDEGFEGQDLAFRFLVVFVAQGKVRLQAGQLLLL